MTSLENKTVFITGASRGIGRCIALNLAKQKANIVIAAKTDEPHPKLPGTIYTVAEEIQSLGGQALAQKVDVRDEKQIEEAISKTISTFGSIDILINNASAIQLSSTEQITMKRFDLLIQVNMRATFATSKFCIPYLKKSDNPHILNLSPPINLNPKWFKNYLPYTMSKYGMSLCTLGMAAEFEKAGIAVNSLWPKTTIATAAIEFNFPPNILAASRKPQIVADAALKIVQSDSQKVSGNFFIDEDLLRQEGVSDFSVYLNDKSMPPYPDLYVDD